MSNILKTNLSHSEHEKNNVLKKALINACELLEINRRELCLIIGVSEATLSRIHDGKRELSIRSKEGELALLFLRCYRSLDTLFGGNEKQCRLWLRHANSHLQGIPAELIKTIQGLMMVVMYLDAMRAKI